MSRALSKEAYLWDLFTSADYLEAAFDALRDALRFLEAEVSLREEASTYPPVVYWQGVMQSLADRFHNAQAMMRHDDYSAMRDWSRKLCDVPRGFTEAVIWMPVDRFELFLQMLDKACSVASKFLHTTEMAFRFLDPRITSEEVDWREWYPEDLGPPGRTVLLNAEVLPERVPHYEVDENTTCRTGERVRLRGVWVADEATSEAALAFTLPDQMMQPAYEVTGEDEDGYIFTRPVETRWRLLRPVRQQHDEAMPASPQRVPAGAINTCSGWWFTPAKQGSRRFFRVGEVFPAVENSAYGATFWQWSPDQSNPALD